MSAADTKKKQKKNVGSLFGGASFLFFAFRFRCLGKEKGRFYLIPSGFLSPALCFLIRFGVACSKK